MRDLLAVVKQNKFYLYLTMFAYFAIYMLFLHRADYLPYVMDGNETYSSLVHAYNMYFGDWSKSFGLTDEAFSPFPEAHPVIHTHQGNWPRVYAFILFALGARTAESQIILHTLTIGAVSIWLMYRYFTKVSSNAFAFIACLIFMTDYVLFAQWHVVTYRVWHCYFVFAILNCMHDFDKSKKWRAFFIFNFAALFYWELVFAFFVSFWSLIYYGFLSKSIKKTFIRGLWMSGSGLIGLCTLFTQLSLFMGWENVIQDFSFTIFARNHTANPEELKSALKSFYEGKNIAFFYNIPDSSLLKGLHNYISSFFKYGLQIHTPVISLIALIACVGMFINYLRLQFSKIAQLSKIEFDVHSVRNFTTLSWLCFLVLLFFDKSFAGIQQNYSILRSLDLIILLPLVAFGMSYITFSTLPNRNSTRIVDFISINLFLIVSCILLRILPRYYARGYSLIWYNELTTNLPAYFWKIAIIYMVLISSVVLQLRKKIAFSNNKGVFKFLLSAVAAYTLIYLLSPGYLHTGYLQRFAPFSVFFTDIIIVLLFASMFSANIFLFKLCKEQLSVTESFSIKLWPENFVKLLQKSSLFAVGTIVLCVLCGQWLYIQYTYVNLFPPDSFNFVKKLRTEEYKNKAIVSNQYTAPFAFETQQWAYASNNVGIGELQLINGQYVYPSADYDYLWLADKANNKSYERPDYFLCFTPNTFDIVIYDLLYPERSRFCSANRVIGKVNMQNKLGTKPSLRHAFLAKDPSDKWAIVKYNWDLPPYDN